MKDVQEMESSLKDLDFNPSASGQEERLRLDLDKLNEWVAKGAQLRKSSISC